MRGDEWVGKRVPLRKKEQKQPKINLVSNSSNTEGRISKMLILYLDLPCYSSSKHLQPNLRGHAIKENNGTQQQLQSFGTT